MHILRAGTCTDESEWRQALRTYWSHTLAAVRNDDEAWREIENWTRRGLIPTWITGMDIEMPPSTTRSWPTGEMAALYQDTVKRLVFRPDAAPGCVANLPVFFRFFASVAAKPLLDPTDAMPLERNGLLPPWTRRLAVCLSAGSVPTGEHAAIFAEFARDGNRVVRYAAQRRLADPIWSLFSPLETS